MPYLTFATYSRETRGSPSSFKELCEAYKDEIVHSSQTLDQFYYRSLSDMDLRDQNQVVTKHITPDVSQEDEWTILSVDHLWLWIIDKDTIITSSTSRGDDRDDPVLERIFDSLRQMKEKKNSQSPPSSVDDMSKFITDFCIDFINQPNHKDPKKSPYQIFTDFVTKKADHEVSLTRTFRDKIKEREERLKAEIKNEEATKEVHVTDKPGIHIRKKNIQDQLDDYTSISQATTLLDEVKDIQDELNIFSFLLGHQKRVWDDLFGTASNKYGTKRPAPDAEGKREKHKWSGPGYMINQISELNKSTRSIQDSVNSLLGLEQNEASISEAESARKQTELTIEQGKTLMIFTIVTIIFLPMSFLACIFALNISSFPHASGNLQYSPGWIFPIIFGVSAAISLPLVILAFYADFFWTIFQRKLNKKEDPKPQEAGDSQSPKSPSLRKEGSKTESDKSQGSSNEDISKVSASRMDLSKSSSEKSKVDASLLSDQSNSVQGQEEELPQFLSLQNIFKRRRRATSVSAKV
ncbi:hypothetical protein F5884DRAFT_179677 [Xylogone sp. PMI_703]|nr:hypothetical protein F5884DRAFT_179677 [Xylogone sp. PMI_703]